MVALLVAIWGMLRARKAGWLAHSQRDASNSKYAAGKGVSGCAFMNGCLLCRRVGKRARLPGGDNHLDGVLDPVSCVSERRGQIGEGKGMGVNLGRVEALFRH